MFVGVLNHDDDRIDHRADGDGNAAQRHNVGTDALAKHDENGNQDGDGQDKDGHEGTAQVHEKGKADQRHNDHFFEEFFLERFNGTVNERTAVVGDGVFHVGRQPFHRFVQLFFHVDDDLARVGAVTHNHNAADGLSLAVPLGDTAPHVGTELDVGDLVEEDWDSFATHAHRHLAEVVQVFDVTLNPEDKFLFRQFDGASADLAIAAFDSLGHVRNGKVESAQLGGVHRYLILFDKAANGGDFGNPFNGGQLITQIPVLH